MAVRPPAALLDSQVTLAVPVISAQAIQAVAARQKGLVVDLDSTLAAAAPPCTGLHRTAPMNRSADWLHQAQADLAQAELSAGAGHHEWACFACHQAVEKALKALHLHHGQLSWGRGLGRSFRDLPPAVAQALDAEVADLEDRLRVLDVLYIPTRYPDSFPEGAPTDHFGRLQSQDALCHARALVDAIRAALAPA
ncbi:HEPN domain-containing protein [Vulcanococcus limneticus]|uniref:HEPN domain-containing protein n=1 Tax=Vulcanococcus limneticus TaxID=2170428 RepID=UPI00398BF4EF